MGNRTPQPPREIRQTLENIKNTTRNMWLNKTYFVTMESLAAHQALKNLYKSEQGKIAAGNTEALIIETVFISQTGGSFDQDISLAEMVSNKGTLVTALDSLYGDPPAYKQGKPKFPEEVINKRNRIKNLPFFSKNEPNYGRGRVTWPDLALQHRAKEWVRNLVKEIEADRRDLLASIEDDRERREKLVKLVSEKINEYLEEQNIRDPKLVTAIRKEIEQESWAKSSYCEMMGIDAEAAEERDRHKMGRKFGLGGDGDDVINYFVNEVRHGKNVNVRVPNSLTSNLFEVFRVPMIGGVSGTTVDFIGAIESQKDNPKLANQSDREAVIAVFMFSMVGAGHHSLVEMICAAKQWGYFLDVPDPFSDVMAALTDRNPNDEAQMTEITTYDACLRAFEAYVSRLGLDTSGTLAWGLEHGSHPRDRAPTHLLL